MYTQTHDLYTCVLMTPLLVLIPNSLIHTEEHELWMSKEYYFQSGCQYLFTDYQALMLYLNRFLPSTQLS